MEKEIKKRIIVAGKFDPLHEGHILHFREAAGLGNYLLVITHPDEIIARTKGYCSVPLWARVEIIRGILLAEKISGEVVTSVDSDGTVAKTLAMLRGKYPQDELIFAKGGDRTPENMPKSELEIAEKLNILIAFGIGGGKSNCSSKMPAADFEKPD